MSVSKQQLGKMGAPLAALFWKRNRAKDAENQQVCEDEVLESVDGAMAGTVPIAPEPSLWRGVRQQGVFDVFTRQDEMLEKTRRDDVPVVPPIPETLQQSDASLDVVPLAPESAEITNAEPEILPSSTTTFVLRRQSDGMTFDIEREVKVLVGRGSNCGVRITDDPQLSRSHATITCLENHALLVDMGSVNGTWLDGSPLQPNIDYKLSYQVPFYLAKSEFMLMKR